MIRKLIKTSVVMTSSNILAMFIGLVASVITVRCVPSDELGSYYLLVGFTCLIERFLFVNTWQQLVVNPDESTWAQHLSSAFKLDLFLQILSIITFFFIIDAYVKITAVMNFSNYDIIPLVLILIFRPSSVSQGVLYKKKMFYVLSLTPILAAIAKLLVVFSMQLYDLNRKLVLYSFAMDYITSYVISFVASNRVLVKSGIKTRDIILGNPFNVRELKMLLVDGGLASYSANIKYYNRELTGQLIGKFLGPGFVVGYNVLCSINSVYLRLGDSIRKAILPELTEDKTNVNLFKDFYKTKYKNFVLFVALITTTSFILIGNYLITSIYGDGLSYIYNIEIFLIPLYSILYMTIFIGPILIYQGKTKYLLKIELVSTLAQLIIFVAILNVCGMYSLPIALMTYIIVQAYMGYKVIFNEKGLGNESR